MSKKHPVIAVTGSSGAGTTTVKHAFHDVFHRLDVNPVVIEGDSFHRYNRVEMREAIAKAAAEGKTISHFGPEGNDFGSLEALFRQYGETGTGKMRYYVHDDAEAELRGSAPGTFTPWQDIPSGTDLLFYEGLHGGVKTEEHDVANYVDLLVGVVPVVNLEWIQKIHRDNAQRGYSAEAIVDTILRRMPDYIHHITPQFSRTHINFQRVPMVDTSNPFIARDIPTPDESMVVIRFSDHKEENFPYLLQMIPGSFMSRKNTIVIPGNKMGYAMELILGPRIERMLSER
ncbi:phosphoribulokinase [Acidithiobacillus sp. CV18-2]|uniref:Phosphoribulokinase n=1 Tax=Igneacidithiobacillus copahuensis TaxID=2724909 RepID=A0AAE3CK15_9PROT|nr:phosphoribulokinase [Igneacidithiobacillus copahuensis]MBU2755096.1 phosphoribulokinase [Acidithiobacillus sp. CV18-3]MBU2756657.1 phosphoribulokinase [Acidithiobacillus sp. BN09-2]MBU2777624.1 phosphoribulokinase [Acidithiobacillus sp. CV18-2]MBU2796595.1 phosphoribulokinase [Acidithiobacillus sp. VAN18-2]MBU2800619.1 phosphoribulokinase [Acidithiobacillus sp. VAN18-4]UTV81273.1 phosphoribulokinase [Acidithiobacillus sp. YTS05]